MTDQNEPRPASTVVLLREHEGVLETLLLRRNKALLFAGGLWVFPGGAIDAQDLEDAGGELEQAARLAAAREAQEESGLLPRLDDMIQLSHWTTPVVEPKRFYTWIYAAPVLADEEVKIDGGEIHDSRWIGVKEAVVAHEAGELGMLPPTYLTLCDVARYQGIEEFLASEATREPAEVFPVFGEDDGQLVVMFAGDAGFAGGNASTAGPRHRAIYANDRWSYVHQDVDDAHPSLID